MDQRLRTTLIVYAVLAVLAGLTLDGKLLWGTWIFLGVFAVKTWLVVLKRRLD